MDEFISRLRKAMRLNELQKMSKEIIQKYRTEKHKTAIHKRKSKIA